MYVEFLNEKEPAFDICMPAFTSPVYGIPFWVLGIGSSNLSETVTVIISGSERLSRTFITFTAILCVPIGKSLKVKWVVSGSITRIWFSLSINGCDISNPAKCSYTPGTSPTCTGGIQWSSSTSPRAIFVIWFVAKTLWTGGTVSVGKTAGYTVSATYVSKSPSTESNFSL